MEHYEHNVGNLAIEVVGQNWSGEVISLYLEDWEVGRVAPSCHLSVDLLCQEMRDACDSSESLGSPKSAVTANKPFSHHGRAATEKERDVVRENKGKKERERQVLLSLSWPV